MSAAFTDPARWAVIDRLLTRALDLPADARAAFVANEAQGDDDLRDAVERLLAASTAPSPLDGAPDEARDSLLREAVRDWDAQPDEALQIPRFRLERELGRGGMGTVYAATRDDGVFDQRVAIKVLRRGVDTADVLARFRQERQILASFAHPHIARLLDGGVTTDGRPYLVMEHVEGDVITTWCTTHAADRRTRLTLFLKVCAAVEYAHQRLVVHRDIKPSNILVDANGDPTLLDFGIAKLLGGRDDGPDSASTTAHADALTRTGQFYATPRYASPEQLRGDPITTATDVYQLGVLLFELLTGEHPIDDSSPTMGSLRDGVLAGRVRAPSSVAGHSVLRGDLDAIVLKALRREATDRYRSVAEFGADVERHLRGEPVHARVGATWYTVRRTAWRHRVLLAASVLSLAGVTAYVLSLRSYAQQLELERNRATQAAIQAEQTTQFLVDLFQLPGDTSLVRGDTLTARTLLERGALRLQDELANQPAVRAKLVGAMAVASNHLLLPNTEQLLDLEIAALREAHGERDTSVMHGLIRQAELFASNRQFAAAALRLQGALDLRTAATPDTAVARLLSALGNALLFSDRVDSAALVLSDAVRLLHRDSVGNREALINTQVALAGVERRRGDVARSEELLRAVLQDATPDATRAVALNNLAALLRSQDRLPEAERYYRAATTLVRQLESPTEQNRNMVANNLASLLLQQRRYDDALVVLNEELATHRANFPPTHWRVGRALGTIAQTLHAAGRYEESLRYRDEQLMNYMAALGPDNDFTVRARADRAATMRALGGSGGTPDP